MELCSGGATWKLCKQHVMRSSGPHIGVVFIHSSICHLKPRPRTASQHFKSYIMSLKPFWLPTTNQTFQQYTHTYTTTATTRHNLDFISSHVKAAITASSAGSPPIMKLSTHSGVGFGQEEAVKRGIGISLPSVPCGDASACMTRRRIRKFSFGMQEAERRGTPAGLSRVQPLLLIYNSTLHSPYCFQPATAVPLEIPISISTSSWPSMLGSKIQQSNM
ncbi:hypothetical protein BKA65DRAFT_101639 [Rhexocercosporidium sp. MPI-PUGE-AT-0058]|nr:hypothetical protein BKA65DRAFT_101639 [Rhexocercosporidium sp. MPI-PUGE-AT-0058]